MSNCHASANKPTEVETAFITVIYIICLPISWLYRAGLLPYVVAVVVVWFAGLPLLYWSAIGSGLVLVGYRREIIAALPIRTEHHRALGVSRFATRAQIEQAYRRAIQHSHPDRGGNFLAAVKLNEAREHLMGRRNHD